jgi:malic enzyme
MKRVGLCRMVFPCFADDYQGLSAAVLAATLGAVPDTGIALKDHRILVLGSGPHRVCIAEMISSAIALETRGMASEARQNIYLADDDGVVTPNSPHADSEEDEMREVLLYSKDMPHLTDINVV